MEKKLDFDDIFDIWHPSWWESPWKVAAVLSVFLLLFFVAFWLVKKYWKAKPIDPRTWALQQLYAINPEHISVSKEFYIKVLDIIKQYMDVRYHLVSRSKTEYELARYMYSQGHSAWVFAIEKIAQHAVPSKFAGEKVEFQNVYDDYMLILDLFKKEKSLDGR